MERPGVRIGVLVTTSDRLTSVSVREERSKKEPALTATRSEAAAEQAKKPTGKTTAKKGTRGRARPVHDRRRRARTAGGR